MASFQGLTLSVISANVEATAIAKNVDSATVIWALENTDRWSGITRFLASSSIEVWIGMEGDNIGIMMSIGTRDDGSPVLADVVGSVHTRHGGDMSLSGNTLTFENGFDEYVLGSPRRPSVVDSIRTRVGTIPEIGDNYYAVGGTLNAVYGRLVISKYARQIDISNIPRIGGLKYFGAQYVIYGGNVKHGTYDLIPTPLDSGLPSTAINPTPITTHDTTDPNFTQDYMTRAYDAMSVEIVERAQRNGHYILQDIDFGL